MPDWSLCRAASLYVVSAQWVVSTSQHCRHCQIVRCKNYHFLPMGTWQFSQLKQSGCDSVSYWLTGSHLVLLIGAHWALFTSPLTRDWTEGWGPALCRVKVDICYSRQDCALCRGYWYLLSTSDINIGSRDHTQHTANTDHDNWNLNEFDKNRNWNRNGHYLCWGAGEVIFTVNSCEKPSHGNTSRLNSYYLSQYPI